MLVFVLVLVILLCFSIFVDFFVLVILSKLK